MSRPQPFTDNELRLLARLTAGSSMGVTRNYLIAVGFPLEHMPVNPVTYESLWWQLRETIEKLDLPPDLETRILQTVLRAFPANSHLLNALAARGVEQ